MNTVVYEMQVVGNEVWTSACNSPTINRYSFDGTGLGTYGVGAFANNMEVIGAEVWAVPGDSATVQRLGFDGTHLGTYTLDAAAYEMVWIPEPGTISLLALGSLVLIRRRK